MPNKLKKYIEINPEVLGGSPVIAGTRIPLERVSSLVRHGYTTNNLKEEYPQVDVEKIQYIISYLMEEGLNVFKKTYKIQTTS